MSEVNERKCDGNKATDLKGVNFGGMELSECLHAKASNLQLRNYSN